MALAACSAVASRTVPICWSGLAGLNTARLVRDAALGAPTMIGAACHCVIGKGLARFEEGVEIGAVG